MNKKYLELLSKVLYEGYKYEDPNRKGVERTQINSYTLEHNIMKEGFPFITSKETYPLTAFKELELFMSGETDIREFWKIGVNFWDKDWMRYHNLDKKSLDLEPEKYQLEGIYPELLTSWRGVKNQVEDLIKTLTTNPMATKKTVTMWDPSVKGVLSPCHWSFEAIVRPLDDTELVDNYYKGKISPDEASKWVKMGRVPKYALTIKWHQHSVDTFLG